MTPTGAAVLLGQKGGSVVTPALNRIEVRRSAPEHDGHLRSHWLETRVGEPDRRGQRELWTAARVGFLRVAAAPAADLAVVKPT